jgi:3D (Asp-Asp-Asp) domain-containing protein
MKREDIFYEISFLLPIGLKVENQLNSEIMLNSKKILVILLFSTIITIISLVSLGIKSIKALTVENQPQGPDKNLIIIQDNSLAPIRDSSAPEKVVKKMKVVITGYSSTPEETDDTPFITAQGTLVRDGIVANNLLPFGTKIRMPELYNNEIFVVEDRMNKRAGFYGVDIWFPSKEEAQKFGAKWTYIEILEN